jgi:hypothetical protein
MREALISFLGKGKGESDQQFSITKEVAKNWGRRLLNVALC